MFTPMLRESVVMSDDPLHALELLDIMEEFGVEHDKYSAYFGARAYRKLRYKDPERDEVCSWKMEKLWADYNLHEIQSSPHFYSEALLAPDVQYVNEVMAAMDKAGVDKTREFIHALVVKLGVKFKCEELCGVFEDMVQRNMVPTSEEWLWLAYSALTQGFQLCKRFLEEMEQQGHMPQLSTFEHLLEGCRFNEDHDCAVKIMEENGASAGVLVRAHMGDH